MKTIDCFSKTISQLADEILTLICEARSKKEYCYVIYLFSLCRTNFRQGVERLVTSKYFLDPDIEHVLVFEPKTKFFQYDIYTNRDILLMDKV